MASPPVTTATTPCSSSDPSLLSPPFIPMRGLPNLRDAGGYRLADDPSRMVRRGVLLRASEPSRLTDEEAARLTGELGVRALYDLRSQAEIDRDAGKRNVREVPGAERIFAPVFPHEDYSPEAVALRFASFAKEGTEGFVQVYKHILETGASAQGAQPFALILRHLATPNSSSSSASSGAPAPILVHCTAGKDRTGVAVALVLSLCGVSDEAVAHDYSLTDVGLRDRREEFVSHLVSIPPLLGDRPAALRMVSSRRESMLDTLAMLRARWGGAEEFVRRECGLSAAEVEAVRANMVVDVGGDNVPLEWAGQAKFTL